MFYVLTSAWTQLVLFLLSPDTLHQCWLSCGRRDSLTWFLGFRVYTSGRQHPRRSHPEWKSRHNTWRYIVWNHPSHPSTERHVLCIHRDISEISCQRAFIPGELKWKKYCNLYSTHYSYSVWREKTATQSEEVWLLCKLRDHGFLFPVPVYSSCFCLNCVFFPRFINSC